MVKSKKAGGEPNLFRLLLSKLTLKKGKRISFYKKFILYYSLFKGQTRTSTLFGNLFVFFFKQGTWGESSKTPLKNIFFVNLKKKWVTAEGSLRVFTHLFSVFLRVLNTFYKGRSSMSYLFFFFFRFHSRFNLFLIFKKSLY